jgi:tetratricopeptide (TPR) repeat protein
LSKKFKEGHALIIGVGQDLPNTIDDAEGLAEILKDKERCAYPEEQVKLLTGENATRDKIIAALESIAKSATADSSVIIYFSGHGYRVKTTIGTSYFLMPYGYDVEELTQTAISGAEFATLLKAIKSKKLLLLLDCCYAGGFDNAKAPGLTVSKAPLPPEALTLLAKGNGRVIIASSQEDEWSYPGRPYSAFTLALIEALSGIGAAKKDGYVRLTDLALYTREMVPKRTKNKQHPILDFEQADNFVVAYYAAGDTEPKGLPFEGEPEIDLDPRARVGFDQRDQTIIGSQINIKDSDGFTQSNWAVYGDLYQIQGNIETGDEKRNSLETLLSKLTDKNIKQDVVIQNFVKISMSDAQELTFLGISPTLKIPPPKFTDLFEIVSQPDEIAAAIFRKGREGRYILPNNVTYSSKRAGSVDTQELLYQTLLTGSGALLVQSRAGLGKTREVAELALRFYKEGWNVCVAKSDSNLNAFASFPDELRGGKFLLVFDALHQLIPPKSEKDESYAERLNALLNFLDTYTAPGEYCVIATVRTEPHFQKKLQYNPLHPLWKRFDVVDLPEFTVDGLQTLLLQLADTFEVIIENADTAHLIGISDRTPRTIVQNIDRAIDRNKRLGNDNWLPSQGDQWERRFTKALKQYPATVAIFQALYLIRETGLPTRLNYIAQLGNRLSDEDAITTAQGLVDFGLLGLRNGILDSFADEPLRESLRMKGQNISDERDYTAKIIEAISTAIKETPGWSSDLINFMIYLLRGSKTRDAEFLLMKLVANDFEGATVYALKGIDKYHKGKYQGAIEELSQAISLGQNHISIWHYRSAAYHDLLRYKEAEADIKHIMEQSDATFAYRLRGDIRKHLGEYAGAEEDFCEVISRGEGDGSTYEELGFVQFQLHKFTEAEASLTKTIELKNCTPNIYLQRAYARYFLDNYEGVKADLLEATGYGLQDVNQYLTLADIRLGMKEFAEAEKDLQTALQKNIKNAELYTKLGYALFFQDKFAQAATKYRLAIKLEPLNAAAWFALAMVRLKQEKLEKGEAEMSAAIAGGCDHANIYYARASLRFDEQKYIEAEVDFTTALERHAESDKADSVERHDKGNKDDSFSDDSLREIYYLRGIARRHQDQYAEAEADLSKAWELGKKDDKTLYFHRGYAKFRQGKYAQAEEDFSAAIQWGGNDGFIYKMRGLVRGLLNKFKEAEEDLTTAIERGEVDASIYYSRGISRNKLKKYAAAEADLTVAINLKTQFADAWVERGYARFYQEKYAGAEADLTEAIKRGEKDSRIYLHRGDARYLLGKYAGAETDYGVIINRGEGDARIYAKRAMVRSGQGKAAETEEDLTKAFELGEDDSFFYYLRGMARSIREKYAEAEADYSAAIKRGRDDANVYRNRGFARSRQGKFIEAEADLNKAIERKLDDAEVYYQRGIARYGLKKYAEAKADYNQAIKRGQDNAEVYGFRGIVRILQGKFEEAEADFSEAIERKLDVAEVYYQRGNARAAQQKYAAAEADFTEAINREQDDGDIYYDRGVARIMQDKFIEAEADFNEAIARKLDDAEVYYQRAMARHNQAKYAEAEADYSEAIKRKQNDADVYRNRGVARRELYNFSGAEEDYTEAIARKLDDADIYYRRGMVRHDQEKYAEAEADYSAAIHRQQDDADVYRNRGVVRMQQSKFIEAEADFSEAIARKLDNANIYYLRGNTRDNQGKYAEAEADYSEAINRQQDDVDLYCLRGLVRLRQKKDAEEDFTAAIEHDPDDAYLYYSRGNTRSFSGKEAEAEADYRTAMERSRKAVAGEHWQSEIRYASAEADYTNAIAQHPDDTRLYYLRGALRLNRFQNEGAAEEDFTAAIKRDPDDAYLYYSRGNARFSSGKYAEAEADYTEAIDRGKDDVDIYDRRAGARKMEKKLAEAESDYTEVIKRSQDGKGYYSRGILRHEHGRYAEAEADYTEAINCGQDDGFYYYLRASTRLFQNKLTEAEADCTIAITKEFYGAGIYRLRAYVYIQQFQFDQARQDCESAAALYPSDPDSLACRADLHLALAEMSEAISQYKMVLEKDNSNHRYFEFGMALLLAGNYTEALDAYHKGIEIPVSNILRSALFDFDFWTGRHANCLVSSPAREAADTIRKLLEMKPGH